MSEIIIIDLDEVESLCRPTRAERLSTVVQRLREELRQIKASLDHEVDSRVRAELEVEQLQRELHDEQVRRDEWEKMYDQALLVHGGDEEA